MSYTRRQGMHNGESVVQREGIFRRGTDMAVLVEINDNDIWLPRSKIELHGPETQGKTVTVVIEEWLARAKGIL